MSGTTYGRTGGRSATAKTQLYVLSLTHIPGLEKLPPGARASYDELSAKDRQKFIDKTREPLTRPPPYLQMNLADTSLINAHYPGAVFAGDPTIQPGNGQLTMSMQQALVSINQSLPPGVERLTEEQIKFQLTKFTGPVDVSKLLPGQQIYRTIGLLASPRQLRFGSVTNKLLGDYMELRDPNSYASIAEWRAATAVLAAWNGDFAHLRLELARDVVVLRGAVAGQPLGLGPSLHDDKNARNDALLWLPGGGQQIYVPTISNDDLVANVLGRPLSEVLFETKFGSRERRP